MQSATLSNCVQFTLHNSQISFYVSTAMIETLGEQKAFNAVSGLLGKSLMPRQSSDRHPYTLLDLMLGLRNKALGVRLWQHDGNTGYGYYNDLNVFQVVDFSEMD